MDDNTPKCSKEMHDICLSNAMCYLCDGKRLFKRPKWMDVRDREAKRRAEGTRKKPKEGMSFEKRVQNAYNKRAGKGSNPSSTSGSTAHRRPNSGAIWSMPGDIITAEQLMECKERGTTTSKGEKTITIQRQQLEKIKAEAYQAKRDVWYYVFGFKGSSDIYLTKDFNDELRMIQQTEALKARIVELEQRIGGDTDAES